MGIYIGKVQIEDHSAILDELDSIALRERAARHVVEQLEKEDPFLSLEVVASARTVAVMEVEPLTDDQHRTVSEALGEHEIKLLSA